MILDSIAPELADAARVEQFVRDFEAARIPISEWTHGAHVAIAGAYLQRFGRNKAVDAAREGIQGFLKGHGIATTLERGYHETLTRFWMSICDAYLADSGLSGPEGIRALVAAFGNRSDLWREYYGFELVGNAEARYGWIVPDKQPLPMAERRGGLLVSTNPRMLKVAVIHGFLSESSYWAAGIPRGLVERAIRGSLCFGLYSNGVQIGFARVITDFATYGYLADVFVLEAFRGKGLGKWLVESVVGHPSLAGFRRWGLATRDAHELYRQFGFRALADPDRLMERIQPNAYGAKS